jgi:hypothetical protein
MAGNRGLRSGLDEASAIIVPTEYCARLDYLKERYRHSIRILPDGAGQIRRFNCFAYALGIWCCPRYERLVDTTQSSVLVNSAFVQSLLANGELSEVRSSEVSRDDVVLYFADNELKHAGRVTSTSSDLVIQSKWGANEVHEHPVWEIPLEHGDQVRFFKCPPQPT